MAQDIRYLFCALSFFISCLLAYQLQFLWATEFFMKAGAITNNDMVIKAGYVGAGHPYAVTIDRETVQQTRHFVLRDDGAL